MNLLRNRGGNALPRHGYDAGGGGGGYDTGGGYGGYNGGSGTGYGGDVYGNSSSSNNNNNVFKDKARPRSGSEPWKNPFVLYGVAAFFVITTLYYRSSGNSLLKALNVKSHDAAVDLVSGLQQDVSKWKSGVDKDRLASERKSTKLGNENRNLQLEVRKLIKERDSLQKERDTLRLKHEGPEKAAEDERITLREEALQQQVALLAKSSKRESIRTVLERFGPGPHQVQFTFALPNADFTIYTDYDFVVELAPLDTLPHAVHLFLEQVAHNLWTGCYFYLNGPHVLQAGPQSFEDDETPIPEGESGRYPALKPFIDLGLETLAFPEYSEDFPHQTWTLGFTGRPGGPDFYINKVDNSIAHGPGGQVHHALHEQGDSCFAKIVKGRENVAMIYQQAVYQDKSDWHYFLEEPIEIKSAVVLNRPPVVNRTLEQLPETIQFVPPAAVDQTKVEWPQQEHQQSQQQEQQQSNIKVDETDPIVDMINDKLKRKPKMAKFDVDVEP